MAALEAMEQRTYAILAAGGSPGPVSSVLKVVGSELIQEISTIAIDLLGNAAAPFQIQTLAMDSEDDPIGPAYGATAMPLFMNNLAQTIFSGSNEIQKNILSKILLA